MAKSDDGKPPANDGDGDDDPEVLPNDDNAKDDSGKHSNAKRNTP